MRLGGLKVIKFIKSIPLIGIVAQKIYTKWINPSKPFSGSENYWNERYSSGGNSGIGSYEELAEFKAEIINDFVRKNKIRSIIEFGCGDGNQLALANYPSYVGFDVSPKAIALCKEKFSSDDSKKFKLVKDYKLETAQLSLSLDVIYHLIEDEIFEEHLCMLFASAKDYVIIYSSDTNKKFSSQPSHIKHRNFTEWVRMNEPEWKLIGHLPNRYPFSSNSRKKSRADFFIYEKI